MTVIAMRLDGCTCVYCQRGQAHTHDSSRFVPIFGSPNKSVCTNCGHKVVFVEPVEAREA